MSIFLSLQNAPGSSIRLLSESDSPVPLSNSVSLPTSFPSSASIFLPHDEALATLQLLAGSIWMLLLWSAKLQPRPAVSKPFVFALLGPALFHTIGHISGCHLNPAVTLGLVAAGRFKASEAPGYVAAQVLGAVAGAALLFVIASGKAGFDATAGFATNGYGVASPGGYGFAAALLTEMAMTFFFLLVILGSTDARVPVGFAGLPIGLSLTLIHLVSIPVTNTSVNPARSTGPALFVGGWALGQLWLFWVAPLIGGALGGALYRFVSPDPAEPVVGGVRSKG